MALSSAVAVAVTRPNNGMHPTPLQRASHVRCVGARVMPGVRLLLSDYSLDEILLLKWLS